jgi:hypothetical protein
MATSERADTFTPSVTINEDLLDGGREDPLLAE